MRRPVLLLGFILLLSGIACSNEPHVYPAGVEDSFQRTCSNQSLPGHESECVCFFDELRTDLPYSEFKKALSEFGAPEDGVPHAWRSQALDCGVIGRD